MKNPFKNIIGLQTFGRIRIYIANIEEVYQPNAAQKQMAEPLKKHLAVTLVKASIASGLRNFFYVILYASVITAFIAALQVQIDFSFITSSIRLMSSLIGVPAVAVVLAFLFDRMKNLYFIDMMLLASTITSIYATPDTRNLEFEKLILGRIKSKKHRLSKSAKRK